MGNENVEYKRAKTSHIALSMMVGAGQMAFYILMASATYIGNANFGILVVVTGIIMTLSRVFDGITDPVVAFVIERYNGKHGKVRLFLGIGWAIMALATTLMCNIGAKMGLTGAAGIAIFVLFYAIYIIGYTFSGVAGSVMGNIITNDPKQRPTISVWSTAYSYLAPMIVNVILMTAVLPKYNGIQGTEYFAEANIYVCVIALIFYVLAIIGISPYDKPENFEGLTKKDEEEEKVSFKDMIACIKENKELQRYMVAACSDKLAQTIGGAAVVTTMLNGIIVGSMQMSTYLSVIGMLPSIIFAIFGARAAGRDGNKAVMVRWTKICMGANIVYALIILFGPLTEVGGLLNGTTKSMATAAIMALLFVGFNFITNGAKMVVSVATNALRMDIIDYELDRTGKYMPATVSATYSFIDKLISSFAATIATAMVGIIGYTTTTPQQGDPLTWGVKIMTVILLVGFPIIGWICTLVSMKNSELSKEKMEEVQKNISEKKAAIIAQGEAH